MKLALLITSSLLFVGCASNSAYDSVVSGTIADPFYTKSNPLGENKASERFVIKTISGSTEYVVEIPNAAEDYDVEVPIADLTGNSEKHRKFKIKNAQVTDNELVSEMAKLSPDATRERALMDRAFGAGEKEGPRQSPSYMLGIDKINELYLDHKFEFALIEINNLMAFYPTSVKLYKMKGTVLKKLRNYELAERAWQRASELDPDDIVITKGLVRLRRQIELSKQQQEKASRQLEVPVVDP